MGSPVSLLQRPLESCIEIHFYTACWAHLNRNLNDIVKILILLAEFESLRDLISDTVQFNVRSNSSFRGGWWWRGGHKWQATRFSGVIGSLFCIFFFLHSEKSIPYGSGLCLWIRLYHEEKLAENEKKIEYLREQDKFLVNPVLNEVNTSFSFNALTPFVRN